MNRLKLSDKLTLPIDAVTQKLAWLGRTGTGKSYGASKLCELMLEADAQVVILDPVGIWWGLRLEASGKKPSKFSLPVFGGLKGDVPLEPTSGILMANVIADRGISAILDVSQFIDTEATKFAKDFATQFFQRRKAAPAAVHVFIEECQEFVPQNCMRGQEHMLHAFHRMIKIGRNFGIGVSLISQRPQEVNKKALNQTECMFAFQMTAPQERKAIEEWVAVKGIESDIVATLPTLETGQPHVWSPQWLKVSKVVRIEPKQTYNASATPKVGEQQVKSRDLAPVDLEKIRTDMAATIEKAKAEDPKELKKRIRELEIELKKKPAAPAAAPAVKTEIKTKEVSVLKPGELKKIKSLADALMRHRNQLQESINHFGSTAKLFDQVLSRIQGLLKPPPIVMTRHDVASRNIPSRPVTSLTKLSKVSKLISDQDSNLSGELPIGERRILTACAQYDAGVTREQLTVLTCYTRSSRNTYLQRLSQRNYIAWRGDRIVATAEGIAALGDSFEPLPTGSALQKYWLDLLPIGERKILEVLISHYPQAVDREELSTLTEYTRSSRNTYLQRMTAKEIITTEGSAVKASDELFD